MCSCLGVVCVHVTGCCACVFAIVLEFVIVRLCVRFALCACVCVRLCVFVFVLVCVHVHVIVRVWLYVSDCACLCGL